MEMRKTVTFTVYNRPWYLARTLNSWEQVRDMEGWTFNFHVEDSIYKHENVSLINSFRGWTGAQGSTIQNETTHGCARNSHTALETAFQEGAEFTVLTEDDVIVSNDILEYFDFMAQTQEMEEDTLAVCASNTRKDPYAIPDTYEYRWWFKAMCWGTWKSRFRETISPTWDFDYSSGEPSGWDCNLARRIIPGMNGRAIMPMAARCLHIGHEGGVHFTAAHIPEEDIPSFAESHARTLAWHRVGRDAPPYETLV